MNPLYYTPITEPLKDAKKRMKGKAKIKKSVVARLITLMLKHAKLSEKRRSRF